MVFYRIYFIWLLFLEYQYANTAVLISGGSLDQCLINEMCYFIYVCGGVARCRYIMMRTLYYVNVNLLYKFRDETDTCTISFSSAYEISKVDETCQSCN